MKNFANRSHWQNFCNTIFGSEGQNPWYTRYHILPAQTLSCFNTSEPDRLSGKLDSSFDFLWPFSSSASTSIVEESFGAKNLHFSPTISWRASHMDNFFAEILSQFQPHFLSNFFPLQISISSTFYILLQPQIPKE